MTATPDWWHSDADLTVGGVSERHGAGAVVFSQGDPAHSLFLVRCGRLTRTVLSEKGRQAVLGILQPGDFFGEGVLRGPNARRRESVTAIEDCVLTRFDRGVVERKLAQDRGFAAAVLKRLMELKARSDGSLAEAHFHTSETRLARVLLLLGNLPPDDAAPGVLPKITQETLAAMVGTTRARVSTFVSRFRSAGHLEERNGLTLVHPTLRRIARG